MHHVILLMYCYYQNSHKMSLLLCSGKKHVFVSFPLHADYSNFIHEHVHYLHVVL